VIIVFLFVRSVWLVSSVVTVSIPFRANILIVDVGMCLWLLSSVCVSRNERGARARTYTHTLCKSRPRHIPTSILSRHCISTLYFLPCFLSCCSCSDFALSLFPVSRRLCLFDVASNNNREYYPFKLLCCVCCCCCCCGLPFLLLEPCRYLSIPILIVELKMGEWVFQIKFEMCLCISERETRHTHIVFDPKM